MVISLRRLRLFYVKIKKEVWRCEGKNLGYDVTKTLHTRLMYYDLKKLTSNEN